MALKTTKSTTLTGQSMIDGQQAVYYSASISDNGGNSTISQSITNQDLYDTNKAECRADFREFQDAVWAIEDELAVGVE
jgi:hypothetical protein